MAATNASVARTVAAGLPATVAGLVRPRRPTAAELDGARYVPPPPAAGGVRVHSLVQSEWSVPTIGVVEGRVTPVRTRMRLGAFLVEHEAGPFLVDAGVCADVTTRHLPEMPGLARLLLTGGPPRTGLADAVRATGVDPADLTFALLTHVHWDHLSGMAELPGLTARITPAELDFLRAAGPPVVLPATLRDVRFEPVPLAGPPVLTFPAGHDVFGDGTVIVCDLAGHTPGHVGVLLTLRSGRRLLLAGDAVWNAAGAASARQRPALTRGLVDNDPEAAYRTVVRLSRLPADITVLPAHDSTVIRATFPDRTLS